MDRVETGEFVHRKVVRQPQLRETEYKIVDMRPPVEEPAEKEKEKEKKTKKRSKHKERKDEKKKSKKRSRTKDKERGATEREAPVDRFNPVLQVLFLHLNPEAV